MKKVILKRRFDEGGEEEKMSLADNREKETTLATSDTKDKVEDNANQDSVEMEECILVIDENTNDLKTETSKPEGAAMDLTTGGEKSKETKKAKTMFSGVPAHFLTRVVRQVVPCKQDMAKRFTSKKVGFTRAQLHAKKSGACTKEFDQFTRAMRVMERVKGEDERDFAYIKTRNDTINEKNASTRGRLMVTRAAAVTEIGDSVEAFDEDNNNTKVKITMVQRIESRLYVVQQGANRQRGQEILTVYSREELEHEDAKPMALGTPGGAGRGRPG